MERRAGWEASRRVLDSFASLASRVSAHLDAFGHAEWQQAIDALRISAVVQPATAGGERYWLTTRLEGVFTTEAIRKQAGDARCTGLAAANG